MSESMFEWLALANLSCNSNLLVSLHVFFDKLFDLIFNSLNSELSHWPNEVLEYYYSHQGLEFLNEFLHIQVEVIIHR
jgi:hypothetical protein